MNRLIKFLSLILKTIGDITNKILFYSLSALTFIMLAVTFGFVVYYLLIDYSFLRVIAGCIVICVMIHLNKSIQ